MSMNDVFMEFTVNDGANLPACNAGLTRAGFVPDHVLMKTNSLLGAVLFGLGLGWTDPLAAQALLSSNGYPWDIDSYSGEVDDGGDDAFDGYGYLFLRVADHLQNPLGEHIELGDFALSLDARSYFSTVMPQFNGVEVNRALYAPADQNYLRYYDTFTNTTATSLTLTVVFGGDLGSDSYTTLVKTSSGDAALTLGDHWVVTMENQNLNPAGPAENDPVVGMLFGNTAALQGFADSNGGSVFTDAWIPYDDYGEGVDGNDGLSYRYLFTLAPGQTSALVYFLYRGQAEVNTDGSEVTTGSYEDGPLATGQINLAATVLTSLSVNPNYTGLSTLQINQIVNFTPVPEPSTWVMLVGGMSVVVIYLRRQHA